MVFERFEIDMFEYGISSLRFWLQNLSARKLTLIDDRREAFTSHPWQTLPDGRFREYKYNREIAAAVVEHLKLRGYDAELLVPEEEDISLEERCRRANKIACQWLHGQ